MVEVVRSQLVPQELSRNRFFNIMNRIKFAHILTCFAIVLAVFGGCNVSEFSGSSTKHDPSGLHGKLVLTGSSTVAPLAQQIAARFEKLHPEVRIDVQTGGSSRGIRDARTGAADIGMSSRELKPDELESVDTTVIAWDGVAFVVHQDNEVDQLSVEQLRQIYLGKVESWSQFGGTQGRIVVSNRANGRSELDLVCAYLKLEPGDIKADVVDGETQQSLKTVISNKKAITYTSVGAAQDAIDRGEKIKLLPLGDVPASPTTVQSGDFPLARPLVLISKNDTFADADKANLIEAFLKFATSANVSDDVAGLGFVGLKNKQSSTSN